MGDRTISEVAFDLWVEEDGLLERLGLAAPERHDAGRQCWRYVGTKLDHQKRKVVHTFSRGVGVREWSLSPWEGERPDFEPVLEVTIHTLLIKAREAWRSASGVLDAAIAEGSVLIVGRVGSPLSDPQTIPPSAWSLVEADDWGENTGKGEGMGKLYDLREAQVAVAVAKSSGGKLRKIAEEAVAILYPNGVPLHVTNDDLRGAIEAYMKANGIDRNVSLDTAKRAAKRR